jgi:hypothetical protein
MRPRLTGFRALRVINDDRVQPGQGFGTPLCANMDETLTPSDINVEGGG